MRLAVLIERLTPVLAPIISGALMLIGALYTGADVGVALVVLARPWGWCAAAAVVLCAVCKRVTAAQAQAREERERRIAAIERDRIAENAIAIVKGRQSD